MEEQFKEIMNNALEKGINYDTIIETIESLRVLAVTSTLVNNGVKTEKKIDVQSYRSAINDYSNKELPIYNNNESVVNRIINNLIR